MAYSKLGRPSNQRKALMRDLITDLIINEQIETTLPKAKALQQLADKMVTLGKQGDLAARRRAAEMIRFERVIEVAEDGTQTKGEYAIQKLFGTIAPKYADRKGGYTQVLKTGPRRGDAAPMAIIKFVE
ncbi:MAG: 50S ribosomal protein L17 [Bacilli bacterium]|jgi:large subunit ribosomal protein L17|nr:50S ribosomal protein L17 [Bacilli bacterium]